MRTRSNLLPLLLAAALLPGVSAAFAENPPPPATPQSTLSAATPQSSTASAAPSALGRVELSAFELAYGDAIGGPASLSDLLKLKFRFQAPSGHVFADKTLTVEEAFPLGVTLTTPVLAVASAAIVEHFNKLGIQGVSVVPEFREAPADALPAAIAADSTNPTTADSAANINTPATAAAPAPRVSLRLVIHFNRAAEVRTAARGTRFAYAVAFNNAAHARIAANSPILAPAPAAADPTAVAGILSLDDYLRRPVALPANAEKTVAEIRARDAAASESAGDTTLLRKDALNDYLLRLNRHPARHVSAALLLLTPASSVFPVYGKVSSRATASSPVPPPPSGSTATPQPAALLPATPATTSLEYLVTESRPWSAYAEISNTGTRPIHRYREHVGTAFYQLTDHDDVLRLDLSTATFDTGATAAASYELPVVFPDYLRIRPFASYGEYTAQDLALALPSDRDAHYKGRSTIAGVEAAWSPFRAGPFSLDIVPGLSWQNFRVNNAGTKTEADILAPMLSLRLARNTDAMRTAFNLGYETSVTEAFDVSRRATANFGNPRASLHQHLLRYEFQHSMFLEPLLFGDASTTTATAAAPASWRKSARTHELLFNFRGQQLLTDGSLIPQKRVLLGGMYSVRGYPEAAFSGDNVVLATAEYRFHLPRVRNPFKAFNPAAPAANRTPDSPVPGYHGQPVNWRTPAPIAARDLAAALCLFADIGHSFSSKSHEPTRTLTSVGVGLELQAAGAFRARIDCGFVQNPVHDATHDIGFGDYEVHFSVGAQW